MWGGGGGGEGRPDSLAKSTAGTLNPKSPLSSRPYLQLQVQGGDLASILAYSPGL